MFFLQGIANFPDDSDLKQTLTIVLNAKSDDPSAQKGNLRCGSPIEIPHGFVIALAMKIRNGARNAVLKTARNAALSVTMKFVVGGTVRLNHIISVNCRELLVRTGEEVERTVTQRIFEVMTFKMAHEVKFAQSEQCLINLEIQTQTNRKPL